MTPVERAISAPLERVGALLERHISDDPVWTLGPVERELGEVQAQARAGLGRLPDDVHFALVTGPDATTQVRVEVTGKSRWTSEASSFRRIETLLDGLSAAVD